MLKRLIDKMVRHDPLWKIVDRFIMPPFRYLDWAREKSTAAWYAAHQNMVNRIPVELKKGEVLHGPFAGMKYPQGGSAFGSMYFPKILGSYEREIQEWIFEALQNKYDLVIDIGCAEGYYAVGFASSSQQFKVVACDSDHKALKATKKMAKVNGVGGQISCIRPCTPRDLQNLVSGRKCLIISDCEGYEKQLFDTEVVAELVRSDVIIETHESAGIDIHDNLRRAFTGTHSIEIMSSIPDKEKVTSYDYKELCGLDGSLRNLILEEKRKRVMVWMRFLSLYERANSTCY
jgi:ribosomal protein L11 methylase PrmA